MKKDIFILIFFLSIINAKAQNTNDVSATPSPAIDINKQNTTEELAKKMANPVAALISLPLQNNLDIGIGSLKGSRYTLNIQPVIPIGISKKMNLITRVILPFVDQYNITGAGQHQSGLSDALLSAFFSPKVTKNGFTWGAGPILLLPTGTNQYLTEKKWGIGPTLIVLKQKKGWTYGLLVNQIWSFAGDASREKISQMDANPFLSYNWKSGAGVTVQLDWTQNWINKNAVLFFVPMFSGLTSFGKQKVSFAIGPRINLLAPEKIKSKFGLRASMTFLFPK